MDNDTRTLQLVGASPARIGMSPMDLKRYSFLKAIDCAAQNQQMTGNSFESECHRAVAARLGTFGAQHSIYIPAEVQAMPLMRRDLTVGSGSGGGYLVATENKASSFIESLRSRSIVRRMGAVTLPGLVGATDIPKQTGAASAYWLSSETQQATESNLTFGQVALAPKTVGAYVEVSRQLTLQANPAIEGLVMGDLAKVLSLAVDLAAINGSGASGQPLGIMNTNGVGSVTGTSLAFAGVLEFQTDVLAGGDLDIEAGGYVTTPTVASLMMQRVAFASTASPLWVGNLADGTVLGNRAMSSGLMPSATMIFGIWSDLIIGEWGVLELQVNPYANFQAGIIGVRGMYSVDVGVRRAASFSVATSIT